MSRVWFQVPCLKGLVAANRGLHIMEEKRTHFGYREVSVAEKTRRVGAVFDSVAGRYDVMNDVMSFGLHRLWKRYLGHIVNVRPDHRVLDLAAGTGDVTALIASQLNDEGTLVACDASAAMLEHGRRRLIDRGLVKNIRYVRAGGEALPFAENYFDRVTLIFGIRNFTDKDRALREVFHVVKPGGQLLVMEFSSPQGWLQGIYDAYLFKVLPRMGRIIAKDAESYRYLAESIRKHPDRRTFQSMMEAAGFEKCDFLNVNGGIVCIHRGHKLVA